MSQFYYMFNFIFAATAPNILRSCAGVHCSLILF